MSTTTTHRDLYAPRLTDVEILHMGKPMIASQIAELNPDENAESVATDIWYDAVLSLAGQVNDASDRGDPEQSLQDWIAAGDYDGTETVESIAAEWDALAD